MIESDIKSQKPAPSGNKDLLSLACFPPCIWDIGGTTVSESQEAIAEELKAAMERRNISVYELFERTGLSCELIESILTCGYDLHDSLPISLLEQELGARLNDL